MKRTLLSSKLNNKSSKQASHRVKTQSDHSNPQSLIRQMGYKHFLIQCVSPDLIRDQTDKKNPIQPDLAQRQTEVEEPVQAELEISRPGDEYEKETDAVADKVMSTDTNSDSINRTISRISRSANSMGASASPNIISAINSQQGNGRPMDHKIQRNMDNHFMRDFSDVRIHEDSTAHQLNRMLNARAFTVNNNIFFNKNQYRPHTSAGKRLLAHELTHVVQQGNGPGKKEKIFRRETDQPPASIDNIKQELESLHNKWSSGAKDGVNLFVTSEIEKRFNRIEKKSVGDFLLSFLGNSLWAATAFCPAGWPAFVVAMTGISIASLPQVAELLEGDKSTNIITATQASMYAYIDFYERRLNDKAREKAKKIKEANPDCSLRRARILYLRESFGADKEGEFYELNEEPDIIKNKIGNKMYQYASEQYGHLMKLVEYTSNFKGGASYPIAGDEDKKRVFGGYIIVEGRLNILTNLYGNRIIRNLTFPEYADHRYTSSAKVGSYGKGDLPFSETFFNIFRNLVASAALRDISNNKKQELQNNITKLKSTINQGLGDQQKIRQDAYDKAYKECNGSERGIKMYLGQYFIYKNVGKPYHIDEYNTYVVLVKNKLENQLNHLEKLLNTPIDYEK